MSDTLTNRARPAPILAMPDDYCPRGRPTAMLEILSRPLANVDQEATRLEILARLGMMVSRLAGWKHVPISIVECEWRALYLYVELDVRERSLIACAENDGRLALRLNGMINAALDRIAIENMVDIFVRTWRLAGEFSKEDASSLVDRLVDGLATDDNQTWIWPCAVTVEDRAADRLRERGYGTVGDLAPAISATMELVCPL
jgi:hypothetical protein